ncbi:hypothetical protein K443DRAFT_12989 [Laccaria amethystina LaAM-08-1]|uniref:Uncharacterized protein n=1 Tax=Laccaria amethystina LaAM-08-1 TaxID=1095629 RepID=A0A0C9WQ88_9AGAR|nr:hypothetical protein K443DRAFT_12989 [Laccaria amethystina LaAM-08-1]
MVGKRGRGEGRQKPPSPTPHTRHLAAHTVLTAHVEDDVTVTTDDVVTVHSATSPQRQRGNQTANDDEFVVRLLDERRQHNPGTRHNEDDGGQQR